jgi:NADPH2:quinone reductase
MRDPGGPEVLQLATCARPRPKAGEVLIRVAAAGINRPDIIQRQGNYPPPADASPVLGLEVAGIVVEQGEGVQDPALGARVCALANGGGYAEYVAVPAAQCLPVPAGFSWVEAAALPETCFTVWSNLFDRARLQPGETLLVHGGAGGIGSTAIQLAAAMGVTVFATAGSAAKCQACVELGATRAINYREEDFVEVIRAETPEAGADVILDMVGGDYIQRNINCAAQDGRIVNIAFLCGSRAEVNFMRVMLKRLTLTGSTLRSQSNDFKAAIAVALREQAWPLLEQGRVRPRIDATFALAEAATAHRKMESGELIGKLVLTVAELESGV